MFQAIKSATAPRKRPTSTNACSGQHPNQQYKIHHSHKTLFKGTIPAQALAALLAKKIGHSPTNLTCLAIFLYLLQSTRVFVSTNRRSKNPGNFYHNAKYCSSEIGPKQHCEELSLSGKQFYSDFNILVS
jgi:hypothetical protein